MGVQYLEVISQKVSALVFPPRVVRWLVAAQGVALLLVIGCSKPSLAPRSKDLSLEIAVPKATIIRITSSLAGFKYQLVSGLTLIAIPDHSIPSIYYSTWIEAGTLRDPPGKSGLANLFKYLTLGRTQYLQPMEFLERLRRASGIYHRPQIGEDLIVHAVELPREKLSLAAKLESERLASLKIEADILKAAASMTQLDLAADSQRLPGFAQVNLRNPLQNSFGFDYPNWRDLAARLEDITETDVKSFYRQYYHPQYTTIIVVGDFTPERAYQIVAHQYEDVPLPSDSPIGAMPSPTPIASAIPVQTPGPVPTPAPSPTVTAAVLQTQEPRIRVLPTLAHPRIRLDFDLGTATPKELSTLLLLSYQLTDGATARLNRAPDKNKSFLSATSRIRLSLSAASLELLFELAPENSGEAAAQAVVNSARSALTELRSKEPPEVEVNRFRNRIVTDFQQEILDPQRLALIIGMAEQFLGKAEQLPELLRELQTVRPRDISRLTQRLPSRPRVNLITKESR